LSDDLRSDLGLTAHGIDGDDAAFQTQQREQLRNGGDPVGLRLRSHLPQHHPVGTSPGADQISAPSLTARSCERRSVCPLRVMTSPGSTERIASTQARKHASKAPGASTANNPQRYRATVCRGAVRALDLFPGRHLSSSGLRLRSEGCRWRRFIFA
jgi:hypothetical protein